MDSGLTDLLELANSERDPQRIALKVFTAFMNYVGAQRGSVFLLADGFVLHQVLANKHSFPELAQYKVATAMSEGLAGWSLQRRQGALAANTAIDERWVRIEGEPPSSAMVVPMISRDEVVGLWSLHHADPGYFRERHLARAAAAAGMLAPVFDAALLADSSIAGLVELCREAHAPSVLVDWHGQVRAVNAAMENLDIVWQDTEVAQSVLIHELACESHREFQWTGRRDLQSKPFAALAKRFIGVAYLLQLVPK